MTLADSPRFRTRPAIATVTAVIVLGFLHMFPGCGNSGPPGLGGPMDGSVMTGSQCSHPFPGCGCSTAGQKAPCGTVKQQSDGFVQCSMGTTTCDGSKWGTCEGTLIVDKTSFTGSGVRLVSLTGSPCGSLDPCDPYCEVAAGDGGETIPSTCASPTSCDEATGAFASLLGNLAGGNQKDPLPCTSGAADNCQYDSACLAAVCVPYTPGDYNTAAGCAALPDFTLGIGCCDATVPGGCGAINADPNSMTMEVCNRGGVVANTGTLVIGINNGSVGGAGPAGCADGASGATWPTGPAIPAGGSTAGWCDINLATTPIGIGSCISFNIAATCTAMGGGPLDNLSGDHWAVANVPATILTNGQAAPIPECDTCNNFTALKDTSATGPLAPVFQCTSTTCGCIASGGSSGCTTTLHGTAYDPGVNVPLPNISVYQPTGALIALPDGVPNCDTCASVLSPYSSLTDSSVTGAFALSVTPTAGSANVVFQTGRWRREITVTGITSCVDNYIGTSTVASTTATSGSCPCVGNCSAAQSAACQTRLPQKHTEGNIPLTAISTGSLEPFECDFAKFMGGTSEMGPPSAGLRIQMFQDTGTTTSPASPDSKTNLWNSQANLNKYDVILLPCSGTGGELDSTLTAAQAGYFLSYAENGGKLFVDHDSVGQMMQTTPPAAAAFNATATWLAGGPNGGSNTPSLDQGRVEGATPTHTLFQTWLTNNGAYGGGFLNTPDPRERAVQASAANAFEWLRGCDGCGSWTGTGNFSLTYSFSLAPTGVVPPGSASACGAVFYNGMHVDTSRGGTGGTFPTTSCTAGDLAAPLSPNEMAFDYLIFALTSCSVGAPPPPPPPPPLPVTTFTSPGIHASCPVGTHVKWGYFEWQATIPPGTSIGFTAQTAPDNGGVPGTYGPAVPVGTANASVASPSWGADACIVDGHLEDLAVFPNEYGLNPACTGVAPPQQSQDWLQVTFTLNPAGPISPTLVAWQQLYDCPPTE
jgi:hypothetical protein